MGHDLGRRQCVVVKGDFVDRADEIERIISAGTLGANGDRRGRFNKSRAALACDLTDASSRCPHTQVIVPAASSQTPTK